MRRVKAKPATWFIPLFFLAVMIPVRATGERSANPLIKFKFNILEPMVCRVTQPVIGALDGLNNELVLGDPGRSVPAANNGEAPKLAVTGEPAKKFTVVTTMFDASGNLTMLRTGGTGGVTADEIKFSNWKYADDDSTPHTGAFVNNLDFRFQLEPSGPNAGKRSIWLGFDRPAIPSTQNLGEYAKDLTLTITFK